MILHCAEVHKITLWEGNREKVLNAMRDRMAEKAAHVGVDMGIEIITIDHIRWSENKAKGFVGTSPATATHVKVTIEREAIQ